MATSAIGDTSSRGDLSRIPSLENHFGLQIGDEYGMRANPRTAGTETASIKVKIWANPYLKSIIPYIPPENSDFIRNAQGANKDGQLTPTASFFWNHDVTSIVFLQVNLKNLINISEVNKCFYLATKNDSIWRNHLRNLLPDVKAMTLNLFPLEQQFKIIYKWINDEKKPYIAKFERNQKKCALYKEKISTLNQTDTIQRQLKAEQEAAKKVDAMDPGAMVVVHNGPTDPNENLVLKQLLILNQELIQLEGNYCYNTVEPSSVQGKLLNAIKVLIPAAFNNQEKFKEVIQKAEVIKNTTSSNDNVIVEDVTESS